MVHDRRITAANRPPLTDLPLEEEIHQLLGVRRPLYEETADVCFPTDDISIANLTEQILKLLQDISIKPLPTADA